MGLSNWFFVGWRVYPDWKIRPLWAIPRIKTYMGWEVEFYKNWLHVMHGDGVLTLYSGHLESLSLRIMAKRGLQKSIYAIVEYATDTERGIVLAIAGYGYKEDTWVGCLPQTVEKFKKMAENALKKMYWIEKSLDLGEAICINQGDFFLSKGLGIPMQYQVVGEEPKIPYLEQMFRGGEKR